MSPLKPGDLVLILLPADPNIVGRMGTLLARREEKWRVRVNGKNWLVPEKALMRMPDNIWPRQPPSAPGLVIAA